MIYYMLVCEQGEPGDCIYIIFDGEVIFSSIKSIE